MENREGFRESNPIQQVDFSVPHENFAGVSEWALTYARNGWKVFPLHTPDWPLTATQALCSCGNAECSKIGKHPRIANWQNAASSDPDNVAAWWAQWPTANIGLSLDGLVCLDVDPRHDGFRSLAGLEKSNASLERTAMQRSGSGGAHYLMRAGGRTVPIARGFAPGLDLLTGTGCYIVAEPSVHATGGRYQWIAKPDPLSVARDSIILPTVPDWLLDAAAGPAPKQNKAKGSRKGFTLPDRIGDGQRDVTLTRYAGVLRRAGADRDGILAALRAENQKRCIPPMEDSDLVRIASSIGKKEPGGEVEEGLIQRLAGTITASDAFARDPGGRLYHFEDGVYRPTGARFVEMRVKALCEEQAPKSWTPELAKRIEQWIAVDAPELWERPPLDVLNVRNGLLNVETRTLVPHSREHLSPVQIAASFDPEAKCPHIDQFVKDVFPSDTQHLPAEVVAWLMLPDTSIQKAILLLGEGANGKSVWLNLLLTFLGRDNVSALSLHRIEADKFSAARLVGKLANLGTDLPTASLVGTSMLKALTGGDVITAERKFEASFEFRPFVRLLFSANSAPRSDDATHGFFRRWLVIPFTRTFDESAPDTVPRAVLDARLSQPEELSGLLNRALDALAAIRQGRFTESASTRAALDEFRRTTDPLAVWLDQNIVERGDSMIQKDKLRSAYGQVCQEAGRPILREEQFTAALKRLRPKVEPSRRRVNGAQTQVYVGLAFVTQDPVPGGLEF
jgi:putative DNA primase/helicase